MDNKKKFVVLEGIQHGNRFYSMNDRRKDPTRSEFGDVIYKVIGYADTPQEAEKVIYTPRELKLIELPV